MLAADGRRTTERAAIAVEPEPYFPQANMKQTFLEIPAKAGAPASGPARTGDCSTAPGRRLARPLPGRRPQQKFLLGLSQRYGAALRKHLQPGHRSSAPDGIALSLGHEAVALGLETLELALLHERALGSLALPKSQRGLIKRAERFFATANAPIEATHRTARQGQLNLRRLQVQLDRRTTELAVTHRQLQQGAAQRQLGPPAAATSAPEPGGALAEALQLQTLLRQLTHRVLAAQEDERLKISHELQDEIAQTLLGIQVRLLALKQEARGDTQQLKNQIAKTQQLVVNSAKSVRQFARKLTAPAPTFRDRALVTL